ncbi:MAG: hypothetical protein NTX86_00395 [Candidatus Dependentiae bacterium]|nr:hypothetical protein [Candidatus Dependentiae bacterium]
MTFYSNGLPSRKEIRDKLESLINGTLTPQTISDWAGPWINNDPDEINDFVVWRALKRLSGADILDMDDSYLHDKNNFISWLADFQQGCALNPEK